MKGKGPGAGPGRELGEGYQLVSLGMTFAGGVIVFMFGGLLLDRWLGLTPVFTIAGTLTGAVLSFVSVYRRLMGGAGEGRGEDSEDGPEGEGP